MPFVDQGEPKAGPSLPIVTFLAVAVVAVVSPFFWYASYSWFNMSYPGGLLAGVAIGCAVRFTLKQPFPPLRIAAIILTVLGSLGGYIWVYQAFWTGISPADAATLFFKDIQALVFTGAGCWIAFSIAAAPIQVNAAPTDAQ